MYMKSANINSTTGRYPANAAPTPAPAKAVSQMGVSSTRLGPNSRTKPTVCSKLPPRTLSPMRKTLSSFRISSANASCIAWTYVSSLIPGPFVFSLRSVEDPAEHYRIWRVQLACTPPPSHRRGRPPAHSAANSLGVNAQLGGDVLHVHVVLLHGLDHGEVLLPQHAYLPWELRRKVHPRR